MDLFSLLSAMVQKETEKLFFVSLHYNQQITIFALCGEQDILPGEHLPCFKGLPLWYRSSAVQDTKETVGFLLVPCPIALSPHFTSSLLN